MNKEILILGKGYIGQRLKEGLNGTINDSKIHQLKDVQDLIHQFNPKIMINCIGYTGDRNVDDCELQPEKTIQANTFVPLLLAEGALRNNIKLVHVSSGCIYHYDYSQSKPIDEKKIPDYFDLYYSRTKIYSEKPLEILSRQFNILITRIRIPLDDRPHPKNLLTKLIQYKKVIDVPNSVTYIPDFIRALKYLLKKNAKGLFNVINKGALYYPDLLKIYQRHVPDFQFELIEYDKLKLKRTNLILTCKKLEKIGFPVRKTRDILEKCVQSYLKN